MPRAKHPVQPIIKAKDGMQRFKENKIVRFLIDRGKFSLNDIAAMEFPREDRVQLAQLIGYSVSGFSELRYVNDADWKRATAQLEDK